MSPGFRGSSYPNSGGDTTDSDSDTDNTNPIALAINTSQKKDSNKFKRVNASLLVEAFINYIIKLSEHNNSNQTESNITLLQDFIDANYFNLKHIFFHLQLPKSEKYTVPSRFYALFDQLLVSTRNTSKDKNKIMTSIVTAVAEYQKLMSFRKELNDLLSSPLVIDDDDEANNEELKKKTKTLYEAIKQQTIFQLNDSDHEKMQWIFSTDADGPEGNADVSQEDEEVEVLDNEIATNQQDEEDEVLDNEIATNQQNSGLNIEVFQSLTLEILQDVRQFIRLQPNKNIFNIPYVKQQEKLRIICDFLLHDVIKHPFKALPPGIILATLVPISYVFENTQLMLPYIIKIAPWFLASTFMLSYMPHFLAKFADFLRKSNFKFNTKIASLMLLGLIRAPFSFLKWILDYLVISDVRFLSLANMLAVALVIPSYFHKNVPNLAINLSYGLALGFALLSTPLLFYRLKSISKWIPDLFRWMYKIFGELFANSNVPMNAVDKEFEDKMVRLKAKRSFRLLRGIQDILFKLFMAAALGLPFSEIRRIVLNRGFGYQEIDLVNKLLQTAIEGSSMVVAFTLPPILKRTILKVKSLPKNRIPTRKEFMVLINGKKTVEKYENKSVAITLIVGAFLAFINIGLLVIQDKNVEVDIDLSSLFLNPLLIFSLLLYGLFFIADIIGLYLTREAAETSSLSSMSARELSYIENSDAEKENEYDDIDFTTSDEDTDDEEQSSSHSQSSRSYANYLPSCVRKCYARFFSSEQKEPLIRRNSSEQPTYGTQPF